MTLALLIGAWIAAGLLVLVLVATVLRGGSDEDARLGYVDETTTPTRRPVPPQQDVPHPRPGDASSS